MAGGQLLNLPNLKIYLLLHTLNLKNWEELQIGPRARMRKDSKVSILQELTSSNTAHLLCN